MARWSQPSLDFFDGAAPNSAQPTRTRCEGALFHEPRRSMTRRTPLACKLRMKISPVYSVSVVLKVAMVAMIFMRFALFRARVLGSPRWRSMAPPFAGG